MKIENIIKQTKSFSNNFEKMVVNLMYSTNWLNTAQKTFISEYDLTMKQYNILRILRGAVDPISTAEIRSRMLDKMSDASRIVDRLEKKELVKKCVCSEDQRKIDVILTEKAQNLLSTIDPKLKDWLASFSNLTAEEANQLSDLLDKMRK